MSSKRQPDRLPTPVDFPKLENKVELLCQGCGKKGKYDVGRIFFDPVLVKASEEKKTSPSEAVGFSGYFHCRHCGAGGPWEFTGSTQLFLLALLLEARVTPDKARIQLAQMHLFDGTTIRTATEGEAHLKRLIDANPDDYFLWSRLANLYDTAERKDLAFPAYTRAIELNPSDVESQYSLGCYQMDQGHRARALEHFTQVLRHCRQATRSPASLVHDMVRDALERWFELHEESKGWFELPPFEALAGGPGRITPEVLRSLDLTTTKGQEMLVSIYLTGKLPTATPPGMGSRLLGGRGPLPGGRPADRIGRNDPCPCGSGKKYKHCCGKH